MSGPALEGQRVVVLGLGRSGRAAARLAADRGARVVGVDSSATVDPIDGVRMELGACAPQTFAEADLVVVSPGVPPSNPGIQAAERAGVRVVGELGFARWFLPQRCIAITGTNGKSTVTTFVGDLLRRAGWNPFVGGNLGDALSLAPGRGHDALVVEVSSYQLERPAGFRPDVGMILNLTPDHLARHGTMERYAATKASLFTSMNAADLGILPRGDHRLTAAAAGHPGRRAWLGGEPGVLRVGSSVRVQLDGRDYMFDLAELEVAGDHNRANAASALLAALAFGADPDALQAAIPHLRGLPHRMEVVRRGDVLWINDSKATNVEATAAALAGLERSAVALLGGQAKGPGFDALAPLLDRHRAVVTFGSSGPSIARELRDAGVAVTGCSTMEEAVQVARRIALQGDAVLLSPGCASFDAFTDFEDRGRVFADLARKEVR